MLSKMTSQIAFTRGARSQSTLAVNFVLVRHGQTEANLAGLIDGQTDSVLTEGRSYSRRNIEGKPGI
jgi:hypothetical protein